MNASKQHHTIDTGTSLKIPTLVESMPNPLWQQDGEIGRQCAAGREHCLQLLLRWEASRDLHEPELLGEPPCRYQELKACVQVFNVLSRHEWHETDFAVLEGYFPWAVRSKLFEEHVSDGKHRLRQIVNVAQEQWSRLHPVQNSVYCD